MVMSRTPDEVKKGLECRLRSYKDACDHQCDTCDLRIPAYSIFERYEDALALIKQLQAENVEKDQKIQQLEAKNTELIEKVEQLQAERDAAVADIDEMVMQTGFIACDWCDHCDCESDCSWSSSNPGFKWRGVQT